MLSRLITTLGLIAGLYPAAAVAALPVLEQVGTVVNTLTISPLAKPP